MLACSESLCESLAVDVTNCPRWRASKQQEVGSLTVWSLGSLEWSPAGHGAGSRKGRTSLQFLEPEAICAPRPGLCPEIAPISASGVTSFMLSFHLLASFSSGSL